MSNSVVFETRMLSQEKYMQAPRAKTNRTEPHIPPQIKELSEGYSTKNIDLIYSRIRKYSETLENKLLHMYDYV